MSEANHSTQVEYRPISGCYGHRIGSDGTVWSCLKRKCSRDNKGHITGPVYTLSDSWRKLKSHPDKQGYMRISLRRYGKERLLHVARLVLEAFTSEGGEGMEACHFPDRNTANNSLSNLRWGTRKDNGRDLAIHGTILGEKHPRAKLTEQDVAIIRAELAKPNRRRGSVKTLCDRFGVAYGTIYAIVHKKNWKHVK